MVAHNRPKLVPLFYRKRIPLILTPHQWHLSPPMCQLCWMGWKRSILKMHVWKPAPALVVPLVVPSVARLEVAEKIAFSVAVVE